MKLVVLYIAFVLLGDGLGYLIGLSVERWWGSAASLFVFLALYFLVLWVAWVPSVRITQPKILERATSA